MQLNKFNLTNKNILITGAAGLLGYEHCIALLDVGARVIMTDVDIKRLKQNKLRLLKKNKNFKIEYFKMNVCSEKSIIKVLNSIKKKFFNIDVLVNNACLNPKFSNKFEIKNTNLENFSLKLWNKELQVGLTGAFLCAKIFGNYMKKNKNGGVIINIASEYSVITPDHRIYSKNNGIKKFKPITYPVIKTGLIGLTKYLATYWSKENIRCNAFSPGGVRENQDKHFMSKIKKLIPMGRMAKPNEYHSVLQFLCSDASSYLNGQNILMDGGRSIW